MGPLSGKKIVEIAGIGPAPFAAMMLADMGAEVIRVSRPSGSMLSMAQNEKLDFGNRGKRCIALNLKDPHAADVVLRLVESADAIIEGYRPGVMEKLGLGPEVCLARNPRIVFGRMTGWGQDGPLGNAAGHDLNYIALTGALHAIGEKGQKPVVPLNLIGDFGGGGMLLAFGVVCAMLEAQASGKGQVVDAAMVDGASALMTMMYGAFQSGFWHNARGATCSTVAPTSTVSTRPPTASTSRSARSSHSSTRCCWRSSGWRARNCRTSTTRATGMP